MSKTLADRFRIDVWFATSYGFRTVAERTDEESAMREARCYLSDSRGVKVIRSNGTEIILKETAAAPLSDLNQSKEKQS
jgi:hypothetical protein